MKIKPFILALGVVASSVAIADSYQSEILVGASREDVNGVTSKVDNYAVQGVYHFNAVNTTNLPLAEAAYLGKNSNVFAGLVDYPHQNGFQSSQAYQVGAEFYIPESFLYVKAGGSRYSSGTYRNNDWFTTLGVTPIDGLLVTTEYNHEEGYDANINAKYVAEIGGQFVNLEAGVKDADSGTIFNIGGDYYFDNSFSVGGNILDADYGNEYTLRTRKFFSEAFSGELSYTDTPDGNVVSASVAFRF